MFGIFLFEPLKAWTYIRIEKYHMTMALKILNLYDK